MLDFGNRARAKTGVPYGPPGNKKAAEAAE